MRKRACFLLWVGGLVFMGLAAKEAWVEIKTQGEYRMIKSNGLANHQTGQFPNRRNPHTITAQNYDFRMPLEPKVSTRTMPVKERGKRYLFGVALNGVIFDPATAEYWNRNPRSGWNYEALSGKLDLGLDQSHAHVQPNGAYHYHGVPNALVDKLREGNKMVLVGYAADGFPIYSEYGYADAQDRSSSLKKVKPSYQLKSGLRPSGDSGPGGRYDGIFTEDWVYVEGSGDLDECNGRFGVTPEYVDGTYHYFLTDSFPFVPRYFRGDPDKSFEKKRGEHRGRSGSGGSRGGPPGGDRPPHPPPHHRH